jgi:predicted RNA-binding protein with PUA domain
MAMFTDMVFNDETGKHEMLFVNQQYDYLMVIYFDPATKAYKFNVSEEEAKRIAKSESGKEVDLTLWLGEIVKELQEADKNPPKKN